MVTAANKPVQEYDPRNIADTFEHKLWDRIVNGLGWCLNPEPAYQALLENHKRCDLTSSKWKIFNDDFHYYEAKTGFDFNTNFWVCLVEAQKLDPMLKSDEVSAADLWEIAQLMASDEKLKIHMAKCGKPLERRYESLCVAVHLALN